MGDFSYSAKDKNGQSVSGMIEAASESEAAEILHNKEMIVLRLEAATKKDIKVQAGKGGKKIKVDDLVIFSRQLATMIDAGISLVQALGILSEQVENPVLKDIVVVMRRDIEAGMSFSDSLSKHSKVFSELFINMVKAGESSGQLDDVLDRLAVYLEKSAALARKIQSALVYPAVVVSMAILITMFLLIKVVPTFKNMFQSMGGSLPLPTQVLIAISEAMQHYFLLVSGALVAGGFLFKRYIGTPQGHYQFDAFKLKAPVFGPLFKKIAVAKFSRTFSTLVKSGVSILNALEIVSKTAGNKVVEETVINCSKSVRDGEPISKPLLRGGVFPPMVCRMISVGEQTGQLEKMLSKIADFFDEQVDAATSAMTSLIEPLVISFLGIVIGGIVIALFLPIFKITTMMAH